MRLSIVLAVLESYEVFQLQLLHFNRIMREDAELIMVDDGSDPPLVPKVKIEHNLKMLYTNNKTPWSIPSARNMGVREAEGEYILIFAIDHILTREAVDAIRTFQGDKMDFWRARAVLDGNGDIVIDRAIVREYAAEDIEIEKVDVHYDTFAMRKSIYETLGGYDEKYDGRYGGCDVDFSNRYGKLVGCGKAKRCERGPMIYVYPNPREDVKGLFHRLRSR